MKLLNRKNPILLAPGPTEVDPQVLAAMSTPAESHFAQPFCDTFGDVLTMSRAVFQTTDPNSQPFIIGGSGSLGWDFFASNFLEPGESILCLTTGFFSDAFKMCLSTYGANITNLTVPVGEGHDLATVEAELRTGRYKALIATHVETSTAVLTPLQPLSDLIRRVSPNTLFVVDGVASVGSEDLQFDNWRLDVVVTGSQKAIGCPPGLSILMVSGKAMAVAQARKAAPSTWYASLQRWLPIMQNYEKKQSSYFATPPTQVVHALRASFSAILSRSLEERFRLHREKSALVKATIADLGLQQLATNVEHQANGVTAFWLPEGLSSKTVLAKMVEKKVTIVGGMHRELGHRYVRFGHMGYSVVNDGGWQVDYGLQALREVFTEFYESQNQTLVGVAAETEVEAPLRANL